MSRFRQYLLVEECEQILNNYDEEYPENLNEFLDKSEVILILSTIVGLEKALRPLISKIPDNSRYKKILSAFVITCDHIRDILKLI